MELLANVDVDDVERAVRFYRDGLGLRLGRRLFDGAVAEMLGASSPIYLLDRAAGSGASDAAPSAVRRYDRHWTPVHLDFAVDDVDAAAARAVAAGGTLESGPTSHDWGRIATLSDPFGHGFCLIAFTERGYA